MVLNRKRISNSKLDQVLTYWQPSRCLEEKLLLSGVDSMDNSNLRYGSILLVWLHINDDGVEFFDLKFNRYVRYC